ncbi:hypothetical protein AB9G80_00320 [Escherichia coli]
MSPTLNKQASKERCAGKSSPHVKNPRLNERKAKPSLTEGFAFFVHWLQENANGHQK